ncbi:MAG: radical SAM protein [Polyangiaceae bacterium]
MKTARVDSLRLRAECDLACWFCSGRSAQDEGETLPTREDGTVQLRILGCDPLRRTDLLKLVTRARAAGYESICVETNGVRLAARHTASALLEAGVTEVLVTGYALDAAVHDAVCGRPGAHARLLQGLEHARAAGLNVGLRAVVLSEKRQDLPALLRDMHARAGGSSRLELSLPRSGPSQPRAREYLPESVAALRPRLSRTLVQAEALGVPVRILPDAGIPPCAVEDSWRSDTLFGFRLTKEARGLPEVCATCAEASRCGGTPEWHRSLWGADGLSPLERPLTQARHQAREPEAAASFTRRAMPRREGAFRVLLVNPCEATWGYGPGAAEYLRAALLAKPDLAACVDVDIEFLVGVPPKRAAELILEADPDLIGMTVYSWNLQIAAELSRLLKAKACRAPIVWGGVTFALLERDASWFHWWDAVDAVARGSGEHTLIDLVRALMKQTGPVRSIPALPGLCVVANGKSHFGPPARVPRLDDFPSPYLQGTVYRVARPTIEMARGCTFSCAFCSDAKQSREGGMQLRGAERLAAEIAAVVSWPEAQWIDAGASTANVTSEAFERVCAAIRRGDPDGSLRYGFQLYPSLARPAQREALQGVNVGALHFGVQSLTPATFAPIKRGTNLSHVHRALQVFEGLPVELSLILGLPGETLDSFKASFDQLLALPSPRIVVNRLLVLPGTELHARRVALGLGVREDRYFRLEHSREMSAAELLRAQDYVIERALALPDLMHEGEARVRWVGFDVQQSFAAPPEYVGSRQGG